MNVSIEYVRTGVTTDIPTHHSSRSSTHPLHFLFFVQAAMKPRRMQTITLPGIQAEEPIIPGADFITQWL